MKDIERRSPDEEYVGIMRTPLGWTLLGILAGKLTVIVGAALGNPLCTDIFHVLAAGWLLSAVFLGIVVYNGRDKGGER